MVLPSPLGFLSPGNGGIEGGVKTIEGRGEATMRIGASAHNFPSLSMRAELVREEYLYEPDGSLLTKGFREIYHTALKKPFMLKHFLYALIFIRVIISLIKE